MIRISILREADRLRQKNGLEMNDFTIFVHNLPAMGSNRLKGLLKTHFEDFNLKSGDSCKLKAISLCYDLQDYVHTHNEKLHCMQRLHRLRMLYGMNNSQVMDDYLNLPPEKLLQKQKLEASMQLHDARIIETDMKLDQAMNTDGQQIFTGKAFLTFKNYHSRMVFLNRFSDEYISMPFLRKIFSKIFSKKYSSDRDTGLTKPLNNAADIHQNYPTIEKLTSKQGTVFNFQGNDLKIFPGVHPNNVLWKNISISTWEKFTRRGILLAATLVILYLSF